MIPCTHNDGLHVWYLTGKKRMHWSDNKEKSSNQSKPDATNYQEHEQVCHNCGETKWD